MPTIPVTIPDDLSANLPAHDSPIAALGAIDLPLLNPPLPSDSTITRPEPSATYDAARISQDRRSSAPSVADTGRHHAPDVNAADADWCHASRATAPDQGLNLHLNPQPFDMATAESDYSESPFAVFPAE